MNEGTPIVLHSTRLLLRDFEEDDLPAILAYHADPAVARFWEETRTEDQSRAWLRETIASRHRTPRSDYIFAIIRTADRALIGQIGTGNAECRHHGSLDFGYALARDYWGHGYMTEALRTLLRFGFEDVGAHRICAECDPRNVASARVMEKAGMQCEAHFRQIRTYAGADGDWHDSLLYAILEDDWKTQGAEEAAVGPDADDDDRARH